MAMITGLNDKVKARVHKNTFGVLPEGTYKAKVTKIAPWKGKVYKSIALSKYGKPTGETVENLEVFNAQATLEVTDEEYVGKRVWYNLTTHPNASFVLENFLYATVGEDCSLADIQKEAIGAEVSIYVTVSSYTKTKVDSSTGREIKETVETNDVKSIERIENSKLKVFEDLEDLEDLGL